MVRLPRLLFLSTALLATLALGACGADSAAERGKDDTLQVIATFSVINDIAGALGGEEVEVHSIVPIGVDPHSYAPLPEDIQAATDADVMFWNGLNMEVGDGWFERLVDVAGKDIDGSEVVEVSQGVTPSYLTTEDGTDSEINPHAFLDPQAGMIYTENIRDGLIAADPDHAETYEANAEAYLEELGDIDEEYSEKINDIPPGDRVLVTSEHAFAYMADRYGLQTGYIWAIDTEEQGTPEQINSLIEFVDEQQVPALFLESNVDERPMETISTETGVEIAATLYSDDLGEPGDNGSTYLDALDLNIDRIHAGLTGQQK